MSTSMNLIQRANPTPHLATQAYAERTAVHSSGQIVHLQGYCPWASHLHDLEVKAREANHKPPPPLVTYVLYPDSGGSYRVQAVAEAPGSFVSRKALPAPWSASSHA